MIERLKRVENPMLKLVNFWVDSILEGYITEFFVDTIISYSEVERNFFQVPHSKYLLYLKTWIQILVCEKGILRM